MLSILDPKHSVIKRVDCIYVILHIIDIIYKGNKKFVYTVCHISCVLLIILIQFKSYQNNYKALRQCFIFNGGCHLGTALINNSEHMRTGFAATSHK